MSDVRIPKEVRRPLPKDGDPRYFCVLQAAFRHPDWESMEMGNPHRYIQVARDDSLANEFRAHFFCMAGTQSTSSIPLGSDRDRAECIVEALNTAYRYGLESHDIREEYRPLIGRMGHRNRNEELMP